jgi:hypothetical protein
MANSTISIPGPTTGSRVQIHPTGLNAATGLYFQDVGMGKNTVLTANADNTCTIGAVFSTTAVYTAWNDEPQLGHDYYQGQTYAGIGLFCAPQGKLRARFALGMAPWTINCYSTKAYNDGKTHIGIVTYHKTDGMTLYVDGVKESSTAPPTSMFVPTPPTKASRSWAR